MAGVSESQHFENFVRGVTESAKRFRTNFDFIFEKYNKPFKNDAVLGMSPALHIVKNKRQIKKLPKIYRFGSTKLKSTKKQDSIVCKQAGIQKKCDIDPNVSMAIARHCRPNQQAHLEESDDSDAETISSVSSDEDTELECDDGTLKEGVEVEDSQSDFSDACESSDKSFEKSSDGTYDENSDQIFDKSSERSWHKNSRDAEIHEVGEENDKNDQEQGDSINLTLVTSPNVKDSHKQISTHIQGRSVDVHIVKQTRGLKSCCSSPITSKGNGSFVTIRSPNRSVVSPLVQGGKQNGASHSRGTQPPSNALSLYSHLHLSSKGRQVSPHGKTDKSVAETSCEDGSSSYKSSTSKEKVLSPFRVKDTDFRETSHRPQLSQGGKQKLCSISQKLTNTSINKGFEPKDRGPDNVNVFKSPQGIKVRRVVPVSIKSSNYITLEGAEPDMKITSEPSKQNVYKFSAQGKFPSESSHSTPRFLLSNSTPLEVRDDLSPNKFSRCNDSFCKNCQNFDNSCRKSVYNTSNLFEEALCLHSLDLNRSSGGFSPVEGKSKKVSSPTHSIRNCSNDGTGIHSQQRPSCSPLSQKRSRTRNSRLDLDLSFSSKEEENNLNFSNFLHSPEKCPDSQHKLKNVRKFPEIVRPVRKCLYTQHPIEVSKASFKQVQPADTSLTTSLGNLDLHKHDRSLLSSTRASSRMCCKSLETQNLFNMNMKHSYFDTNSIDRTQYSELKLKDSRTSASRFGFDQNKWILNEQVGMPNDRKLKRKASGSQTSDYFTDPSLSPKCGGFEQNLAIDAQQPLNQTYRILDNGGSVERSPNVRSSSQNGDSLNVMSTQKCPSCLQPLTTTTNEQPKSSGISQTSTLFGASSEADPILRGPMNMHEPFSRTETKYKHPQHVLKTGDFKMCKNTDTLLSRENLSQKLFSNVNRPIPTAYGRVQRWIEESTGGTEAPVYHYPSCPPKVSSQFLKKNNLCSTSYPLSSRYIDSTFCNRNIQAPLCTQLLNSKQQSKATFKTSSLSPGRQNFVPSLSPVGHNSKGCMENLSELSNQVFPQKQLNKMWETASDSHKLCSSHEISSIKFDSSKQLQMSVDKSHGSAIRENELRNCARIVWEEIQGDKSGSHKHDSLSETQAESADMSFDINESETSGDLVDGCMHQQKGGSCRVDASLASIETGQESRVDNSNGVIPHISKFLCGDLEQETKGSVNSRSFLGKHSRKPKLLQSSKTTKQGPTATGNDSNRHHVHDILFPPFYIEKFSPSNPKRMDSDSCSLWQESSKEHTSLQSSGSCVKKGNFIRPPSFVHNSPHSNHRCQYQSCNAFTPEEKPVTGRPPKLRKTNDIDATDCASRNVHYLTSSPKKQTSNKKWTLINSSPTFQDRTSTPVNTLPEAPDFPLEETISTIFDPFLSEVSHACSSSEGKVRDGNSTVIPVADRSESESDSMSEIDLI